MTANEESKPLNRNLAIECEAIDVICTLELAEYVLLNMVNETGNGDVANRLHALKATFEGQRARLDSVLSIPVETGGDGR